MADIIVSEQEVALIQAQDVGAVVAPQIEVATIVEAISETVITTPQSVPFTVEVGQQGPPGRDGLDGQSDFPDGNDGDLIQFNAETGAWESRSEPFDFNGIILNPMLTPESAEEGFLFYNVLDDSVYVAVE
ncbi:MAG: hypothetical protein WC356_02235 [Candidatus Micrarchaeia archaeon]